MSTSETNVREEEARRYYAQRRAIDGDADAIERELDSTRAEVRADLEALERRLSVDRLLDLTVGRIRERGGEFAGNLSDAAIQNPVPLLLTSIGVGWLMLMSRRNGGPRESASTGSARRAASRVSTAAGEVGETLSTAASGVGERLSTATSDVGERLHGALDSSRETFTQASESLRAGASRAAAVTREHAEHTRARVDELLHEQPLMLGALGIAAGLLIGALLPATETEDRLLGDVRDTTIRKVARTSRKGLEAARAQAATYSAPEADAGEQPTTRPH